MPCRCFKIQPAEGFELRKAEKIIDLLTPGHLKGRKSKNILTVFSVFFAKPYTVSLCEFSQQRALLISLLFYALSNTAHCWKLLPPRASLNSLSCWRSRSTVTTTFTSWRPSRKLWFCSTKVSYTCSSLSRFRQLAQRHLLLHLGPWSCVEFHLFIYLFF